MMLKDIIKTEIFDTWPYFALGTVFPFFKFLGNNLVPKHVFIFKFPIKF